MKYPNITVKLIGNDPNAFFILVACREAAKKGGLSDEEGKGILATVFDNGHILSETSLSSIRSKLSV